MTRATRLLAVSIAALAVPCTIACDSGLGDLPSVERPLDYATVHVELPGCEVRLPPVHDVPRCSPDDIGRGIDARAVCRLLSGLKDWVEHGSSRPRQVASSDWRFVRSSCVSRAAIAGAPHDGPSGAAGDTRTILTLYVDVPERSVVLFAQMSEQTRTIDYFVSPR